MADNTNTKNNLTTGNPFTVLIKFALPFLLSSFMQSLYGMVDLFVVGLYNDASTTTAVSIGSQVMHMLTVIIIGLAMGSTVKIGYCIGAKDYKTTAKTIGNSLSLFALLSIIVTFILLLCKRGIVNVMLTPIESVSQTNAYLLVCFAGIPFIVMYNIISSIFRGLGDSKTPMYFVAIACVINIILDFVFVGFLFLVPSTMLSAISAITAQNYGAGKKERATLSLRYALSMVLVFGGVMCLLCQFFPGTFVGIFSREMPVIEAGALYLMSYAADCIFAGVHFVFSGYFCGIGKSGISFIHNIISILVMRIPGAYLASVWFTDTLYPMGWAAPLGSLISAVICVGFYVWSRKNSSKSYAQSISF